MQRACLDASTDSNTMMLIRLAQAMKLSGALPPESGRDLERMAKAVRLFAQARENGAAVNLLDQMMTMLPEGEPDLAESRAALRRGVDRVSRSLGFSGVLRARQDAEFRSSVAEVA